MGFKFEWIQSDGEILCHPIIAQKTTSCRVKLQIDKTSSSPKLLQIRNNLNSLEKIMTSVKGDCDLKGANIDMKTVDELIKSNCCDVSTEIWRICRQGSVTAICAWINHFLQRIQSSPQSVSVADDDDSDIASRITK